MALQHSASARIGAALVGFVLTGACQSSSPAPEGAKPSAVEANAEPEPEPEPPPQPTPSCDEVPPLHIDDVWVFDGAAGPAVALLDSGGMLPQRGYCRRVVTVDLASGKRLGRMALSPSGSNVLRLFEVFEHEGKPHAWLWGGESTRFTLVALAPLKSITNTAFVTLGSTMESVTQVHKARVEGATIQVMTDQGHQWEVDAFGGSAKALPPGTEVDFSDHPDRPWHEQQRYACAAGTAEFGFERIYGNREVEMTECPRCRIRWGEGQGPPSADVFLEPQAGRVQMASDRGLRRRERLRLDARECVGQAWGDASPRLVVHRDSLGYGATNMLSRVRPDGTTHWQQTVGGEQVDAIRVSADRVLLTRSRLQSGGRFRRLDVHDLETGERVWAYPDGRLQAPP
ncbi:MAG: hypothetical protein AAF799_09980 [Myxococcota bacterium]